MAKEAKKAPPEHGSKSSASIATEHMKRDQAIEDLGRRIIKELDDRDITAKWMAAYLSELMVSSEDNDATHKQQIVDLILKLWRERRHYPGNDPMQRYEKALTAMELHLSSGDPVFQVMRPSKPPSETDENKIGLARKLKHHSSNLVAMLVKAAIEEHNLDQDKLAEIANIAAPDAETRFLSILRNVVYESEEAKDQYSELREEISVLRRTLDELEVALQTVN